MPQRKLSSRLQLISVCAIAGVALSLLSASADDWPQWRGPNRDGIWRETGLIETFPAAQIELKWRAPISNGYSGPTVAEGRVYVTDRIAEPAELERVLCFDAATGAEIWKHEYACPYAKVSYTNGPRASVTIASGLAYALGSEGHMRCLDAATGALVWKKDPGVDYEIDLPIWGTASSPLVEGELLIAQVGARPNGCIVAWEKATGVERWRALEDGASYSAPIVIEQAGQRVLVCWTGEHIVGLNPATGDVYWKEATPHKREILNVATPVVDNERLFLTSVYDGSLMFRLPKDALTIKLLWKRCGESEKNTDALHAMISTPFLQGGHIYGTDCYGQLRCLKADTGDRVWEDLTATTQTRWGTIHTVQNGGKVWMFNECGELIIAQCAPDGFHPISRAKLIAPTKGQLNRGDGVCWSHPAYAYQCVFARNDAELVCANLAAK